MVVKIDELSALYPHIYHMAWENSWKSIREKGLLDTASLLEMYKVSSNQRKAILTKHRPECVELICDGLPKAVVRDQKPMSDRGVVKALGTSATPEEWYSLLNSMVFFWPTLSRLKTMLSARAYRKIKHDVLVVRTAPLIEAYRKRVRISPINSGCTTPFAHPRTPEIFYPLESYPFQQRLSKFGKAGAVAEVCIQGGVPDIAEFVDSVCTIGISDIDGQFGKIA